MTVDAYENKILRLVTRLESFSKSVGHDLGKILNDRFKRLAAEVATGDTSTLKNVAAIEREFTEILQNVNADQTIAINKAIETGAVAGYGAESAGLALAGEAVKAKVLNEKRLITKAWDHILQEQSISVDEFWSKYINTSSQRVKAIPRLAYQQGWSITKTVSKLRQLTGTDKNSALAVARTTVLSASNVARADVISQTDVEWEIYKATLDSRTTTECRRLDGSKHKVGHGPMPGIHVS